MPVLEKEIWKDVPGYEGKYQVSNLGRVRSLDRYIQKLNRCGNYVNHFQAGRILSSQKVNSGYLVVHLYLETKRTIKLVHRLVAFAFVPGYSGEKEVNHKNGDKTYNYNFNLEWLTRLDNVTHARKTGLAKLKSYQIPIKGVHWRTGKIIEFPDQVSAETFLRGRRTGGISHALKDSKGHAYGYKWSVIE